MLEFYFRDGGGDGGLWMAVWSDRLIRILHCGDEIFVLRIGVYGKAEQCSDQVRYLGRESLIAMISLLCVYLLRFWQSVELAMQVVKCGCKVNP